MYCTFRMCRWWRVAGMCMLGTLEYLRAALVMMVVVVAPAALALLLLPPLALPLLAVVSPLALLSPHTVAAAAIPLPKAAAVVAMIASEKKTEMCFDGRQIPRQP